MFDVYGLRGCRWGGGVVSLGGPKYPRPSLPKAAPQNAYVRNVCVFHALTRVWIHPNPRRTQPRMSARVKIANKSKSRHRNCQYELTLQLWAGASCATASTS
eukprot:1160862-Pelagomonas_calceolata.AAC.13